MNLRSVRYTLLGTGMALVAGGCGDDLLNPDVIVLGTIGTAFFDLFEPRIREVLETEALPRAAEHVVVRPSTLTDRGNQTAIAVARRIVDES